MYTLTGYTFMYHICTTHVPGMYMNVQVILCTCKVRSPPDETLQVPSTFYYVPYFNSLTFTLGGGSHQNSAFHFHK